MSSWFARKLSEELRRARKKHAKINSLHEGYAIILEEMDEFKAEVWKKRSQRDKDNMLEELVQIAAMCQRAAEDLLLPQPVYDQPPQDDTDNSPEAHGIIPDTTGG